jgi:Fe-S-cluster containining protein
VLEKEKNPAAFQCRRCGECCRESGIIWSELDPRAVMRYLDLDLFDFVKRFGFVVDTQSGEIRHPDFSIRPCPFLAYEQERAVCTIYPLRPTTCRGYPAPGERCRRERRVAGR